MPTYAPPEARCEVFTYKEGLLSAVGHDVKLAVERFEVTVEADRVEATFDAGSIAVVCARKDGRDNPGALSDKDKRTIEGYVRDDVLHSRRYPKITFASEVFEEEGEDERRVEGELSLHGRTREIEATVRRDGDRWVCRVRLHQPDFGITPFKAMLGALRIQAHVDVELSVP
ncbi:MAG: YceI family protein [Myxococcota bacterium]